MMKVFLVFSTIILSQIATTSIAACRRDPRGLQLKQADGPAKISKLGTYNCGNFSVEFDKLSNIAATMAVSGKDLALLKSAIGKVDAVKNDVYKKYLYLVDNFSTPFKMGAEGNKVGQHLRINESEDAGVLLGAKTASYSRVNDALSSYYPAVAELEALNRKVIPNDVSVYYYIFKDASQDFPIFWRYSNLDEIGGFYRNMDLLNSEVKAKNLHVAVDPVSSDQERSVNYSKYLGFLKYVAGQDGLPPEFLRLEGVGSEDECGNGTNTNWNFNVASPELLLNVALVKNTSKRALRIDSILGVVGSDARLRPVDPSNAGATGERSVSPIGIVLQPGHTLLIPTQIIFEARNSLAGHDVPFPAGHIVPLKPETVAERLRSEKFTFGPQVSAVPAEKTYAFGPNIDISSLVVDGTTVDLDGKSSNYIDVSFSYEGNSCPYLLGFDAHAKSWIELGKVLDKANGIGRLDTQTTTLPGLVLRFRVEEREPEVATLKSAQLKLVLKNGKNIMLRPDEHGDEVQVFWGEATEFRFGLPSDVLAENVVESQFSLTGFYQRYSDLRDARSPGMSPRPAASSRGDVPVCLSSPKKTSKINFLIP